MESYAAGETEPPLLEETIGGNFDRTVAAYPDREALVEFASGRRWTYRELNHDVDLFARGLIAGGLAKGDRIGVWAPSCAEWTIAQLATAKVGAILVNVNPAYRRAELEYAMNKVECKALILAPALKTSNYLEIASDLVKAGKLPHLKHVVRLGPEKTPGMLNFDDVVQRSMTVVRDGEKTWPPPPVSVSAAPAAQPAAPVEKAVGEPGKDVKKHLSASRRYGIVATVGVLLFLLTALSPPPLIGHLVVFALAIVIGYYVIGHVHHALGGQQPLLLEGAVQGPAERRPHPLARGLAGHPVREEGPGHPVPRAHPRDARPHRHHPPHAVRQGHQRQRLAGVVLPLHHEEVAVVEARRAHPHHHLPRPGHRRGRPGRS